jgi:hypothetical protein
MTFVKGIATFEYFCATAVAGTNNIAPLIIPKINFFNIPPYSFTSDV